MLSFVSEMWSTSDPKMTTKTKMRESDDANPRRMKAATALNTAEYNIT